MAFDISRVEGCAPATVAVAHRLRSLSLRGGADGVEERLDGRLPGGVSTGGRLARGMPSVSSSQYGEPLIQDGELPPMRSDGSCGTMNSLGGSDEEGRLRCSTCRGIWWQRSTRIDNVKRTVSGWVERRGSRAGSCVGANVAS